MKKIITLAIMLAMTLAANAQLVEIYKGSNLVGSYIQTEADRVVFKELTKVTNINLSSTSAEIYIPMTLQLSATVLPANATVLSLTWTSDNTSVATVSDAGLVTPVSVGTAIITAAAKDGSGVCATCTVIVKTHEYVELGLPSGRLWAKTNVGTDKMEGAGNYFAWGETEQKSSYNQSNYKYYKSTTTTTKTVDKDGFETTVTTTVKGYTKYVSNSSNGYDGFTDYRTILDASDDAATVKWGTDWCMPSKEDWQELKDNCTWEWVSYNSVNGYKVTSKTNGNFLFLPSTGYNYWSCSLSHYISCTSGSYSVSSGNRYDRNRVRPVRMIKVTGIELSATSLELHRTCATNLSATISPASASKKEISWASSDSSVVRVINGVVIGISVGTATVTATAIDGSSVSASCDITVQEFEPEYVDLGLSVKWATCNVGAEKPEDYGDYFAWGETAGYNSGKTNFGWGTYKWCKGSYTTMTKYCTQSGYGTVDSKTVLDPADDVATVNWGSDWRMPTDAELRELIDNCTWTWYAFGNTEFNGVAGYKVTSNKTGYTDKSLFLPAAGYRDDTYLYRAGSDGLYRSSSLNTDFSLNAWYLYFRSDNRNMGYDYRFYGRSVRPVR